VGSTSIPWRCISAARCSSSTPSGPSRVAEGSYRWRGELRLWDNEALIGWYRSTDAAVRSKGTLYLALHQHGTYAWV
jgi:hypothetical protein